MSEEPLARLRDWYEQAVSAGLAEADAMALATATPNGAPSVRYVLLKGIDERGVRFFTNYESRKGRELSANPRGAVAMYWHALYRQVRLEGRVEALPAAESDAYFASRARASQLGAWASPQGRPIPDRTWLEARVAEAEARFPGEEVPRPTYWGGYRIVPEIVEFWRGRPGRLHDREQFTRRADGWRMERLAP